MPFYVGNNVDNLEQIVAQATRQINDAGTLRELDDLRVGYLGKKGQITGMLKSLGGLDPDSRKSFGQAVNKARDAIATSIAARKDALETAALNEKLIAERVDVSTR
jgi:phenylalanyl-tRNA synthetase alpha chain